MAKNRLLPIGLPLLGLNTVNPFVDFDSGYAREFTNYGIYNGRPFMRPAVREQTYEATQAARFPFWFSFTGSIPAILDNGDIRELSGGGAGATSIGGAPQARPTRVQHGTLDLIFGCREPRLAASPFTAWSFTTISITATGIICGCSHKGRLFVADGSKIEYSQLGALTGTMEGALSVTGHTAGQAIQRMFSISANLGASTEDLLVIFFNGGRVLVYSGDYPSANSNFRQIGKFDMPAPISNLAYAEVDSDIFVATKDYPYWFRDLFTGGTNTAHKNSPGRPIENIWAGLYWPNIPHTDPELAHTFYEPMIDAIITMYSDKSKGPNRFDLIANYQNEAIYLAYFRQYNAWAVWFMAPFFAPTTQSAFSATTKTVYGGSYTAAVSGLTFGNSVDEYRPAGGGAKGTIDIEATWKTPYTFDAIGHKVNGVRVYFGNSVSGYFHESASVFDYSDYNSVLGWRTQSTVTAVPPGNTDTDSLDDAANTWGQYLQRQDLKGVGGAVSFSMTQKRKTASAEAQAHSIFGAVAHLADGGERFV